MIFGDAPANVNVLHDNNDDAISTTSNNDETNVNKEQSSLSHAATLHGMFSGDDHDDLDCMRETKNDIVALANEYYDDNDIEEDQIKIEHDKMIILRTKDIQTITVVTCKMCYNIGMKL